MDPELCLYHKDKDGLNSVQKELQKCGWLPRKHSHRLAMAVCNCRKHKGPMPSRDENLDNREKLKRLLEPQREALSQQLLSFIDHCLNASTETDYSNCQFISILVKAKLGDYNMLSRAVLSTNSKISERDLQREINRKKKLTEHQIEIIKNKKKKKMDSHLVKLPVFPGNFLKLKLNCVSEMKGFIELHKKINNENFESKKLETWVKVWGNPSNMKTLAARLIEESRAVQERMDKEWKMRRERKAERRRFMSSYIDDSDWGTVEDTVMSGFLKDDLTNDFSLKVQKNAKSKTKAKIVKAQSSVLDSGHCLQCFKAFTDLHDNTPCTYHKGYVGSRTTWAVQTIDYDAPGYISQELSNKRIWSCCSQEVEEIDAHLVHNKTGCTTSRVHNWRTHKKAKGKDWEKFNFNKN